jgi:putative transposase
MLRALLTVARQIGAAHDIWVSCLASRRSLVVELSLAHERLEKARSENDLLRARLRRLKHNKRPHYRRFERLAILWHASRYGMSVEKTAKAFVLSPMTVFNWRRRLRTGESTRVEPKHPINRLPDLVADVARRIKREWPKWGTRRIAGVLARMGIKASRTSVQAFLRQAAPPRRPSREMPRVGPRHVVAKRPGHVWMIDFTRVGGRLVRSVVVGAVVDAFSRKVLSIGVAPREPTSAFAVTLLEKAVATEGRAPTYLVSDHGRQLIAREFGEAVARRGIRHRFGAVHRSGSIARIEVFWKSMKREYAGALLLFRSLRSIEEKLRGYVAWFNGERPHQGLDQRTPDEVHLGCDTRAKSVPLDPELTVRHLEGDPALPVLSLRHAA